jgi:sortase A
MSENQRGRRRTTGPRRRRRVSVVGIFGELLITAGVLVFLFLGWQLWLNDLIVGGQQDKSSVALAHDLSKGPIKKAPAATTDFGAPVVATQPADATKFGVIYIPRLGATYARTLAEGVGTGNVLDNGWVGHYPGTQMPGQVGNFAVAAHRTTHGAPFHDLATLQVGDKIYVQTADGYYTYEFRGLEYVRPTGVGVLDAVPEVPNVQPTDRLMTMTSCNPMFSASERIIAYASFVSWQPTSAGAPAAIVSTVQALGD